MQTSRLFRIVGVAAGGMLLTGLAALLGFGAGRLIAPAGFGADDLSCDADYSLLNPYLRCEPAESLKKSEYTAFKGQLESYIKNKMSSSSVDVIAVYFRDLENGPWFGIQEDALFSPASLLKLPVLVTYYRKAEFAPQILRLEIETEGTAANDQNHPPEESLQPNQTYTIDELLRRMIVYSDNDALHILLAFLAESSPDDDIFAETLAAMGLAKSEASADDFLTVKRYSAFYRALYNASFLSKEMSQKALDLLTQTTFHQGIDEGVPPGTPVAHKYGIRREGETVQLHDCGIVYHPDTHYILCIMTKGDDSETLSPLIQEISKMTYAEVGKRN